ncbi:MAG: hemerythrin family protein [Rhodospirillales bacterium]|nr:hemerythrin family protein [Rhodospirillales bacterium]
MPKLQWKQDYEIGNPSVDREHEELVRLINFMIDAAGLGGSAEAFGEAFNALERYMEQHFKNEENFLDATNNSNAKMMKNAHRNLEQEFKNLWASRRRTPSDQDLSDLLNWAENKLLEHFLMMDRTVFKGSSFN